MRHAVPPQLPHPPKLCRHDTLPSYRQPVQRSPSLDITQRIERKLLHFNSSQNVVKRWLFEIISWVTSAACMSAIVGILLYCKDQPLSQRSLALTAYSVLSKIASAALILPISEAIGQLKWNWFGGDKSKDIVDFEIFDKASRGAWGSLLLIFRTKGRSLAALGAVLTLLLLATDTFFQQVTDYPDRWALEQLNSTIASVLRYEPLYIPEYFEGWENSQYDMSTSPTVRKFFYGNGTHSMQSGNSTRPEIPLSCPASNCTWPEYNTLGICSQCVELVPSEVLTRACLNTTIDWSAHSTGPPKNAPTGQVCGYFLNATSNTPTLMSGYILSNNSDATLSRGEALLVRTFPLTELLSKRVFYDTGSIHFKNLRNTLLDALIVSARNGTQSVFSEEEPIIHECALSWCVKTIQSSYSWGNYREEVTAVSQNKTKGPRVWDSFEIPDNEGGGWFATYQEDINVEAPSSNSSRTYSNASAESFGASNGTAARAMAIFDDFFPSYYTADNLTAAPALRYKNYMFGPSIRALPFNAWQAPNDIGSHMARMATAMSDAMRSTAESISMVPGLAYNRRQFVLVRWQWLTFPFALLAVSLGFLVATIVKTSQDGQSGMGIWKTSAMPTLIYSLPKDMQQDLKPADPSHEKAKVVKIKLHPGEGWRVSGHKLGSPTKMRRPNIQPPPGWI